MKKEYKKPITETVVLNLSEQITKWGEGANPSNTGEYTGAKENGDFWDMDDDDDPWGEKPNADKYDLWND